MKTQTIFDKQHYIEQMQYVCACIMSGIAHDLREIIVDNFAGGGGASTGIEMATGYSVYAAINHDPEAIRMHMANHPSSRHYCESVWDVNPLEICDGHPVGLVWFSPDCKHFSKAKGGKPKDKTIRGLAWVALRWAGLVRPRVIMLENVEEFKDWGPLNRRHRPIKSKKGVTFGKFVKQFEELGYTVEYRELVAADYGAPTTRKRFFLIARCDGQETIWPKRTHAPAGSDEVKQGLCKPYLGAYTQIDFSRPCPSIFATKAEILEAYGTKAVRPLAENTMRRIARGLQKFVLENPEPFIIQVNHGGERRPQDIREPMPTITSKHGFGIVNPYIVPIGYGEREGQQPRVNDISEPLRTAMSTGKHYVCTPYIAQIGQTGFTKERGRGITEPLSTVVSKNEHCLIEPVMAPYIMCNNANNVGRPADDPLPTVTTGNRNFLMAPTLIQYHSETTRDGVRGQELSEPILTLDGSNRYGLVSAFLSTFYSNNTGKEVTDPLQTVTAGGQHSALCAAYIMQQNGKSIGTDLREPANTITAVNHMAEVRAFLIKYYGNGTGQDISEPLDTVTGVDRFGLVQIQGIDYQIVDIGLRMLDPDELYGCMGFPDDYVIDRDCNGKVIKRAEQVRKCGNAVSPPIPAALVRANLPELCTGKRLPICRLDRLKEETTGQIRFA